MSAYSMAYADIYYILNSLDEEYVNKIPTQLIEFFRENREPYYLSNLDMTKPLTEQYIRKETEQIICLLNLNYWCSPEEKKELLKKYSLNEKTLQEQLHEKYDLKFNNKRFTDNAKIQDVKTIAIIEKDNFFTQIIKLLKKFFNKKN